MHRQAESAADRLESLLRERDADRTRLAEVQQALQEAMQHLEDLSDEAQVLLHLPLPGGCTGICHYLCLAFLKVALARDVLSACLMTPYSKGGQQQCHPPGC